MAVVYKKHPLATFAEQLPALIMQYQKEAANKAYDTQMFFLRNEVDKSRELNRERRSIINKSRELGITNDLLGDIKDEQTTVGSKNIVNTSGTHLNSILNTIQSKNKQVEDNIDKLATNISYFELGKSLIQQVQDDDPFVTSEELGAVKQKAAERLGFQEDTDATLSALNFIEKGALLEDEDFYTRLAQKQATEPTALKVERELEKEGMLYVRRAEAAQYPTIRNIEGLDDDNKRQGFQESSDIAKTFTLMDHSELDEIAELGATEGGAGYDDVLPARFDYSDKEAFQAGLRIKAERYLEDKMGVKGYDEDAIKRYMDIANTALRGGDVLTLKGERERYKANVAFAEFEAPDEVSVLKATVSKAIYQDPEVQKVLGQKDKLATTLKSFVLDKDNNIREGKEWSDVKKEARELGFTKSSYNQAIKTLAGITDTNILEIMYIEKEDIRKLLKLTTGTTAASVLRKLNLYEKEVESRLIQTKRTIKEDTKEEIDYKNLFGG